MLIFYTLVHVWGSLALMEAGRDKKLGYKFSPLRTLTFATIQNLVSFSYENNHSYVLKTITFSYRDLYALCAKREIHLAYRL